MKLIKIIFTIIVITMALTLIFTTGPQPDRADPAFHPVKPVSEKRIISRFLQQKERNPRAADHCHKDNDVCNYTLDNGRNATCCNNKCMDLEYDNKNCGACKKKCAFTETCCRGECVNLAYDKRHCGICNNKCMDKGYCIYGICDYA
ncbi:hypothetical protein BUALT_Bualt16G0104700 [Buddleja alternifolia]|uniref:Stigma-specific Stig1 family protein n=1 Tax=Buddleja alternifolia TaxID=168488 RepID=A0AAV6WIU9_9LAMI|nr:hypothetical protein BUALT_Bualt16G0104700 [Buddleja alternifolia]